MLTQVIMLGFLQMLSETKNFYWELLPMRRKYLKVRMSFKIKFKVGFSFLRIRCHQNASQSFQGTYPSLVQIFMVEYYFQQRLHIVKGYNFHMCID